jgi:hypothetical protein
MCITTKTLKKSLHAQEKDIKFIKQNLLCQAILNTIKAVDNGFQSAAS